MNQSYMVLMFNEADNCWDTLDTDTDDVPGFYTLATAKAIKADWQVVWPNADIRIVQDIDD